MSRAFPVSPLSIRDLEALCIDYKHGRGVSQRSRTESRLYDANLCRRCIESGERTPVIDNHPRTKEV